MASERSKLDVNVNDSKNTRMNLVDSMRLMDFRKDELMHIGRYFKACQTAINLSKELDRPIKVLDLGCGEAYTMRLFYKSFLVKKADVIERYFGVDIDKPMLKRTKEEYAKVLEAVNGKLIAQDLTVNETLKLACDSIDLVIWFEMIEHIQPEFVRPILAEVKRVLNPEGILLLSTPNSNGSNKKLPKDHVYEWSYEELKKELKLEGFKGAAVSTCINPSRIPSDIWRERGTKKSSWCIRHLEKTRLLAVLLLPHYFLLSTAKICCLS